MKLYVKYKVNSLVKIRVVDVSNEDYYYYRNSISKIKTLVDIITKLEQKYVSNIEILDYSINKLI